MTERSRRGGEWPTSPEALVAEQARLAALATAVDDWTPPRPPLEIAGCYVCFSRGRAGPGEAGEPGWAAAALMLASGEEVSAVASGVAGAPYEPGLLAAREGPLLEEAVRLLPRRPDVLLVNATGRDHPRRAGLAMQLGSVLGLPSIGVTHRPLAATGPMPGPERGATGPLVLDGEVVAHWVRTRRGTRPLVAHPGWQMSPSVAASVLLAASGRWRTPEALRRAREAARRARTGLSR